MSTLEWILLLLINLGISFCYQGIPRKLAGLLSNQRYIQSTVNEILEHRANNIHLLRLFIRWCGVHHFVMVPLMFALMNLNFRPAALVLIGVDLAVLVVSWQALRNIVIPQDADD